MRRAFVVIPGADVCDIAHTTHMAIVIVSLSSILSALFVCALLGAKIQINFIVDVPNDALCVDVFSAGVHMYKMRLFAVADGIFLKPGSADPARLARRKGGAKSSRCRRLRKILRPIVAAIAASDLRCDHLTVRLALPLGDHPATEIKLLAADFAISAAKALLSPRECDCFVRVADVRHAALYGSVVLSAADALDCALRCAYAAKAAKSEDG